MHINFIAHGTAFTKGCDDHIDLRRSPARTPCLCQNVDILTVGVLEVVIISWKSASVVI